MDMDRTDIIRIRTSIGFLPDCEHLIYVEKSHNEEANDFLMRYLTIDERLLFLPRIARKLIQEKEVVEYANPAHRKLDFSKMYNTILDYVEDSEQITCGFLHYTGFETTDWYEFSYTPYGSQSEEELRTLFDEIIESDCKEERLAVNDSNNIRFSIGKPDNESADDTFSWESKLLIDEIKQRVRKLEQSGISRAVLFKLLGDDVRLSRMIVDSKYRIYLIDYGYMEVKMTPLVKAVYLLFLNHTEGILFKELASYKKELTMIYSKISNRSDVEDMKKSIDDICNPLNNSINEKCARIREAFVERFDSSIAENYFVTGKRGDAKRVKLDRELLIWGNEK